MHFRVVKTRGRKYNESIDKGTVRVKLHSNHVTVCFNGPEKSQGTFTTQKDDAERLAHALLLASATEDTAIQFPFDEIAKT